MTSLTALLAIAAFCLGAILGSFLNALSFRWGTGVSIWTGRSRCMHCGHTLHTLDLVPIVSWFMLRGRCRYCGARISWQYPLVELIAGISALVLFLTQPLLAVFFALLVVLVMLFIAVYDLRHGIILWEASFALMGLVFLYQVLFGSVFFSALDGLILSSPLFFIVLISNGRWMGGGDAVLEISLGWLLGFTLGLTALMLAFWAGAAVGIVLLLHGKGITMKSEVPFAPFLIGGALVAFLFHVDIFASLPALL